MSEAIPTQVQADFLSDGSVRPRQFTYGDRTLDVIFTGRQWIENHTRHVLVMTSAHDTLVQTSTMCRPTGCRWSMS